MPLKLGTTNIGAIYKGTTPISAIYKGTTLVFSSFTWQEYLYEYLYHNLVPTTINSKSVQDKAKLVEIQGNSCVVNQLLPIPTISSQTLNGITLTNNNDGTITIQGTASDTTTFTLMGNLQRNIPLGHTVMITNFANPSTSTYFLFDAYESNVAQLPNTPNAYIKTKQGSSTIVSPRIRIENGTVISTPQTTKVEYIDLTQQFTFDTPTSLDDTRVKRIIEQGYIPYNSGEIKYSVIGEISSSDTNDNLIGTITLPAPLGLGGVNTAHNTFEITKTNYVFTRNVFDVDLTKIDNNNWQYDATNTYWYIANITAKVSGGITYPSGNGVVANIICDNYDVGSFNDAYNNTKVCIGVGSNGRLAVYNNSSTTTPTGTLYYQLATPQVINIPRKHLGVVDLGSLYDWDVSATIKTNSSISSLVKKPSANSQLANVYCSKYRTSGAGDSAMTSSDLRIGINTNGVIRIYDTSLSGLTNSQVREKLSGIYLFYETNAETTDFNDEMLVQSGGTITTNSEVLPNVKLNYKCK